MKTNRYLLGLALLVVGTMPSFSQVSNDNEDEVYKIDQRAGRNDFVPGQLLVKFKDENPVKVNKARGMFISVNNSAVDAILKEFSVETMDKLLPNEKPNKARRKTRAMNGQMVEERDLSQLYLIKTEKQNRESTMQLVEKLRKLDEVEYAEPNYKVYMLEDAEGEICSNPTQNPLYKEQWGIGHLNINAMWNLPLINKRRPVIAIVDTGVDINHPDLKDNIWTNPKEGDGSPAQDDDKNGYVDDTHGWNFVENYMDVSDNNGHGTHVAGIAAACNNELGIVGANPLAYIMPVKVLQSDGSGDVAKAARGIIYAAENGADIINMSFGGGPDLALTLKDALDKAFQTSILVASAGNNGKSIYDNSNPMAPGTIYPAAYYCVLGVQALQQDGSLAGYSNYDPDGPTFSTDGVDGRNYELKAPGTAILSTMIDGDYRQLNGTSMASPLVAGAISALQMLKKYGNREMLFGDLIHLNCDFAKMLDNSLERGAMIDIVSLRIDDSAGNNDGRFDAGEIIKLYPTIRNTWKNASNIKLSLTVDEMYKDMVAITSNDVDFGFSPSYYGRNESMNPIIIQLSNSIGDGTKMKMKLTVTADGLETPFQTEFVEHVNNLVKLNGLLSENTTLTADKNYLVTGSLGILDGVTLTLEPGTIIQFERDGGIGVAEGATIIANGLPGKPIRFTRSMSVISDGGYWAGLSSGTYSYCIFEYASRIKVSASDCVFTNCNAVNSHRKDAERCNIINNISYEPEYLLTEGSPYLGMKGRVNCNYVNNIKEIHGGSLDIPSWSSLPNCNYYNNFFRVSNTYYSIQAYTGEYTTNTPHIYKNETPSYLGSTREDLLRPFIYEIGNVPNVYGQVDLSNMLKEPVKEAHGIVWKVVVNGKDAQDEYEDLDPLGVGKHKFEVYFNRPMNKAKIPQISFGVREPYTQNAVAEDGAWNDEGTIYTAYVTITGKTQSDGVNRIYVYGAEDNEFFECPYEKTRFNVNVQSAGSMATGFTAEAGMGRVNLTWNNDNNDFEDAMGFNIYRYTIDEKGKADTICINKEIVDIETTEYTDYNVTPRTTYHYLYRVLSTDLREFDVSNVVAATPLTSTLGDANGSGDVNVMDVVTTVNYVVGMDPKPFIFEAADVNKDLDIDVLDVVGIVNLALNQSSARAMTRDEVAQAVYTIENGVLYVETPVTLAGLQVQFAAKAGTDIKAAEGLNGFEQASAWLTDEDYMLMAYSFGSKNLQPGKHALLHIGDAEMTDIRLGDLNGNFVKAVSGSGTTAIDKVSLTKTLTKAGVYNLNGQKVAGSADSRKLQHGVYIINGQKIVK